MVLFKTILKTMYMAQKDSGCLCANLSIFIIYTTKTQSKTNGMGPNGAEGSVTKSIFNTFNIFS